MLYNPMTFDADQLLQLLPARLEQLSDLTGLELERVVGWGFVMAVLSEVWTAGDNDEIDGRPSSPISDDGLSLVVSLGMEWQK